MAVLEQVLFRGVIATLALLAFYGVYAWVRRGR